MSSYTADGIRILIRSQRIPLLVYAFIAVLDVSIAFILFFRTESLAGSNDLTKSAVHYGSAFLTSLSALPIKNFLLYNSRIAILTFNQNRLLNLSALNSEEIQQEKKDIDKQLSEIISKILQK
jgi:hypothetical protein